MKYRRRKHRDRVSHDRWLVSYADFITLLFAFFVVMYSTAQIDKKKAGQLATAIQTAFQQMGAFPPSRNLADFKTLPPPNQLQPPPTAPRYELPKDLAELRQELEKSLAPEIAHGEVALHNGPDGLVISLREMGFFDSGAAGIKTESQSALNRIAELLAPRPDRIRIEGHTDNVPINNAQFASNWELSTARATELVRFLITQDGFAPERLSAAGYAEYHPVASNDTPTGQAQNRRVDLVILSQPSPVETLPSKPSPEHVKPQE